MSGNHENEIAVRLGGREALLREDNPCVLICIVCSLNVIRFSSNSTHEFRVPKLSFCRMYLTNDDPSISETRGDSLAFFSFSEALIYRRKKKT